MEWDGEETRKAETGEAERRRCHFGAQPHMPIKSAESAELKEMLPNSGCFLQKASQGRIDGEDMLKLHTQVPLTMLMAGDVHMHLGIGAHRNVFADHTRECVASK